MRNQPSTINHQPSLLLLLVLAGLAPADTYYLAPHGTGSESVLAGTSRDDRVCIEVFRDSISGEGDEGLCVYGSYGNFTLAGKSGTNPGAAGNHVIYRADPAECTPRSADWWSRTAKLETPDPTKHPVFGKITFNPYESPVGSYNNAVPYYITLDGLWIDQSYLHFYLTVSDVNIVNCNIFCKTTNKNTQTDQTPIYMQYYGSGTAYQNIRIKDCYLYGGREMIALKGHMRGGVTITGCHGYFNGSGPAYAPQSTVEGDPVIFRTCNIHSQQPIGEYDDPHFLTRTVDTVDAEYPRKKFTTTAAAALHQFVEITDATDGTTKDYERVAVPDATDTSFELAADIDFDIEPGDSLKFTDSIHGSGISLRGGDITFDRCLVWGMGLSRLVYAYNEAGVPVMHNVHFTNNLFYNSYNVYSLDFALTRSGVGMIGEGFWFNNNTVLGNRGTGDWAHYYTDHHQAEYYYGHAISLPTFETGTDTTTCQFCNNIVAGWMGGGNPGSMVRNNNILWHNGTAYPFAADNSDPTDANNTILYNDEEWGTESHVFDADGTYFVAANADFDDAFTTLFFPDNLYADLMLKLGAPAIDMGDPEFAPLTEIGGGLRVAPPDVGAREYGATSPSAPTAASVPSPTDGKTLVRETADLSWTTGGNSPTHHVFFSTDLQDVTDGTGTADKGTQAGTTYDPGTMANNTTYYWRIQEENDDGHADGTVWSFQTRPPPTPKYGLIGRKGN